MNEEMGRLADSLEPEAELARLRSELAEARKKLNLIAERAPEMESKCLRKSRMKSRQKAKNVCLAMASKPNAVGILTEYECQYCGGWHVGHVPSHISGISEPKP